MQEKYKEAFDILEDLKSIPEVNGGDLNKIRHILRFQRELMSVYSNAVNTLVSEKIKLQEELDANN